MHAGASTTPIQMFEKLESAVKHVTASGSTPLDTAVSVLRSELDAALAAVPFLTPAESLRWIATLLPLRKGSWTNVSILDRCGPKVAAAVAQLVAAALHASSEVPAKTVLAAVELLGGVGGHGEESLRLIASRVAAALPSAHLSQIAAAGTVYAASNLVDAALWAAFLDAAVARVSERSAGAARRERLPPEIAYREAIINAQSTRLLLAAASRAQLLAVPLFEAAAPAVIGDLQLGSFLRQVAARRATQVYEIAAAYALQGVVHEPLVRALVEALASAAFDARPGDPVNDFDRMRSVLVGAAFHLTHLGALRLRPAAFANLVAQSAAALPLPATKRSPSAAAGPRHPKRASPEAAAAARASGDRVDFRAARLSTQLFSIYAGLRALALPPPGTLAAPADAAAAAATDAMNMVAEGEGAADGSATARRAQAYTGQQARRSSQPATATTGRSPGGWASAGVLRTLVKAAQQNPPSDAVFKAARVQKTLQQPTAVPAGVSVSSSADAISGAEALLHTLAPSVAPASSGSSSPAHTDPLLQELMLPQQRALAAQIVTANAAVASPTASESQKYTLTRVKALAERHGWPQPLGEVLVQCGVHVDIVLTAKRRHALLKEPLTAPAAADAFFPPHLLAAPAPPARPASELAATGGGGGGARDHDDADAREINIAVAVAAREEDAVTDAAREEDAVAELLRQPGVAGIAIELDGPSHFKSLDAVNAAEVSHWVQSMEGGRGRSGRAAAAVSTAGSAVEAPRSDAAGSPEGRLSLSSASVSPDSSLSLSSQYTELSGAVFDALPLPLAGSKPGAARASSGQGAGAAAAMRAGRERAVVVPHDVGARLASLYRRWLLQRFGWLVVSVSYQDYGQHIGFVSAGAGERFLEALLQTAAQRELARLRAAATRAAAGVEPERERPRAPPARASTRRHGAPAWKRVEGSERPGPAARPTHGPQQPASPSRGHLRAPASSFREAAARDSHHARSSRPPIASFNESRRPADAAPASLEPAALSPQVTAADGSPSSAGESQPAVAPAATVSAPAATPARKRWSSIAAELSPSDRRPLA